MIVELENARYRLLGLRDELAELGSALRIDALKEEVKELERQSSEAEFWSDREKSSKVLKEIKHKKNTIAEFTELCSRLEDAITLADMAIEENDLSSVKEVCGELEAIEREKENKKTEVLLSGEYDKNNAIVSFHPGAGGTEAQDWTQMLFRMITRWAEKHDYDVKTTDWLDGDEAGLKSATVMIEGLNAYGYLKSEHGIHRLVRVSPFDASGRRHTSFASIEVMPEFSELDDIVIREEDYDFMPYHSSGAGGQNVNKVSSAVRLCHKPSGIVVTCQTERSQLQNKETAMRMLKSKLMEIKIRERLDTIEDVRGVKTDIEWGNQIRSYVFMPYTLVKDIRTGYEDANITAVMDGDIDGFINAYLKAEAK